MARKNQKTTQELINAKEQEIKLQKELLSILENDLKELNLKKEDEDKNEIYSMIKQSGLTKEEIGKIVIQLANKKEQSIKATQNTIQPIIQSGQAEQKVS